MKRTREHFHEQRHREVAAELIALRLRLQALAGDVCHSYGSVRRVGRTALKTVEAVDSLRAKLDEECARDLGLKFDTKIYYPGPGDSQ